MRTIHRWTIVIGVLLFAAAVGFAAFQVGTAHGVEISGKLPAGPAGAPGTSGASPYPYPHAYWGWHGPWGFGLVVFPLLFFAFWFLVLRAVFWRSAWHAGPGGGWRRGWRPACYGPYHRFHGPYGPHGAHGPHGRCDEHEAEGSAAEGAEES